ncbi:oxamate carbamoyltransferase subunit AllG family protein [Micromonospora lutea]|uniref:Uncharacterized protein n=1 Tax=Micromonospora lutea TaxID=419825 RepID=A0ABQ4J291_9ACTN|nr:DUF1116 domain-containing protein [Micromonospora lutea]GIJ24292.1 hypothetical protein Vlu01_49160 [Micromonospora lutea]
MPDPLADRGPDQASLAWESTQVNVTGARLAGVVCPDLDGRTFLHPGPPLDVADASPPMRSAIVGALLLEGQADDPVAAERLIDRRDVRLVPSIDAGAVVPMTGVLSPSMPVVVVTDADGRQAFGPLENGAGACLRFGCHDLQVLDQIRWIGEVVVPVLDEVARLTPLNVTRIMAESLRRGDECHARTVAGSSLLLTQAFAALLGHQRSGPDVARVARWCRANLHLFGAFATPAARLLADVAHGAERSPIVTTLASNGIEFGIRVSGADDQWFVTEAPVGEVVLFDGYRPADAHPIAGDSFVMEVVGLGAMALAASPVVASQLGWSATDVARHTARMREITVEPGDRFRLAGDEFRGVASGIDVHRVARTGIGPSVNTGIVHRRPGVGQIGGGIAELPTAPFREASAAMGGRWGATTGVPPSGTAGRRPTGRSGTLLP